MMTLILFVLLTALAIAATDRAIRARYDRELEELRGAADRRHAGRLARFEARWGRPS